MEDKLYPIMYKGKAWNEDECDPIFVCYYSSPFALRPDKSVYVADGESITPDGTWVEY